MLEIVDCELTRLKQALVNAGLWNDTTFIVVGDNGSAASSYWPSTHQKGTVYEGGVRVPLIVSGKNVASGASGPRVSNALVNTVDIFATALELMGVDLQDSQESGALQGVVLDSRSFLPILQSESGTNGRTSVYVENFDDACDAINNAKWNRAIRDSQYKLIQRCEACTTEGCCYDTNPSQCEEELYAVSDVRECCNLIDNPPEGVLDDLRSKFPGTDILCRAGDYCQGCCDDDHCASPTNPCDPYFFECCGEPFHECCGDPALFEGISVTWFGPPEDPGPQLGSDYVVNNVIVGNECQPHVVLQTTEVPGNPSSFPVQRYTIGRANDHDSNPQTPLVPLPIGTVSADWESGLTGPGITVQVGEKETNSLNIGDVDVVAIPHIDGGKWSSVVVEMLGNLTSLLKPTAVAGAGGRVRGVIDGTLNRTLAEAVGSGEADGGELKVGGLASTGSINLVKHESISTLKAIGSATTAGDIVVDAPAGIFGPLLITQTFDGKLCAANLIENTPPDPPSATIPSSVDVSFGMSGRVCDESCATCVMPCSAAAPLAPTAESPPLSKNRYISFKVPQEPGDQWAIRVILDSLHRPSNPPAGAPDFTESEFGSNCSDGGRCVRYVNKTMICQGGEERKALCKTDADCTLGGTCQAITTCPPDSPNAFRCATLGCSPEYDDWNAIFGTDDIQVTAAEIIPDSNYVVQVIRNAGSDYACRSPGLVIKTAPWGDTDGNGQANVLDLSKVVDVLKGISGHLPTPQAQVQPNVPESAMEINVQDLSYVQDALKGFAYPFFMTPTQCPCQPPQCP